MVVAVAPVAVAEVWMVLPRVGESKVRVAKMLALCEPFPHVCSGAAKVFVDGVDLSKVYGRGHCRHHGVREGANGAEQQACAVVAASRAGVHSVGEECRPYNKR